MLAASRCSINACHGFIDNGTSGPSQTARLQYSTYLETVPVIALDCPFGQGSGMFEGPNCVCREDPNSSWCAATCAQQRLTHSSSSSTAEVTPVRSRWGEVDQNKDWDEVTCGIGIINVLTESQNSTP